LLALVVEFFFVIVNGLAMVFPFGEDAEFFLFIEGTNQV